MWSLLLVAGGLFLTLCLCTYQPADIGVLSFPPQRPPLNLGGTLGAWIGFLGRGGFGWASSLISLLCFLWAVRLWREPSSELHGVSLTLGLLVLTTSVGTLLALRGLTESSQTTLGGIVGFLLARAGKYFLGTAGTVLTALCAGLLSWVVVSAQMFHTTGFRWVRGLLGYLASRLRRPATTESQVSVLPAGTPREAPSTSRSRVSIAEPALRESGRTEQVSPPLTVRIRSTMQAKPKKSQSPERQGPDGFQLPSVELLASPPPVSERQLTEDLQVNAKILEETLREFGVEAHVVNIDRGPTVTRYELTPAPGVKLTKIVSLADDLALVMKAASCHIVAPIPGKGRVGIDVPNTSTTIVYLKEILTSDEFRRSASVLALPIGKDVSGHAIITDLRECPHLLIAGATGSGKTVCLNSLLTGVLLHASPEQVKF